MNKLTKTENALCIVETWRLDLIHILGSNEGLQTAYETEIQLPASLYLTPGALLSWCFNPHA